MSFVTVQGVTDQDYAAWKRSIKELAEDLKEVDGIPLKNVLTVSQHQMGLFSVKEVDTRCIGTEMETGEHERCYDGPMLSTGKEFYSLSEWLKGDRGNLTSNTMIDYDEARTWSHP